MTTPEAAKYYESQHVCEHADKQSAIFNPHNKAVADLPVIYGFNNGGSPGWFSAVALAEDGTVLGGHICSSEAYMPHDLGILEGTRSDRHETYREHYPDGYRMEFVPSHAIESHGSLMQAIAKASEPKQGDPNDV